MSTELIDKLTNVLKKYKDLSTELTEVQKILAYAENKVDDIRVELRFSAAGKTKEFTYPTQTAINQLRNMETKIVSDMEAIEEKLESALSDT
jgi:predicted  nucleic acid-binding Zn-ribbon protein